MEAYSLDLRERVMVAVEEGFETRKEIAESFGVTTRWIRKFVQQYRETGRSNRCPTVVVSSQNSLRNVLSD